MENKFMSYDFNVARDETLLEDTIFYPIKNKTDDNSTRLKTGTAVKATYTVVCDITTKHKLSGQQMRNISNVIKAFFVLKGDEAVDEKKLSKFIKQETGISVKVEFVSVGKQYETGFRPGIRVQTEVIDLLNVENNVAVD